jgi:glycosyltransferase involved in cell wall biosynthesis
MNRQLTLDGGPAQAVVRTYTTSADMSTAADISAAPPAGYDRAAWRTSLGIAPGDLVLCYFGFLSPSKGGETLVRALGQLQQGGRASCRLLMVGGAVGDSDPTSQAYLGQVWTLIRQLGLEDRVNWTGFAAPDQVSAHLLASDMAVLPYREGANLRHGSLHAALAHGLPVVTTLRPDGGSALVDDRDAVLVPPGDPSALAEAVTALAADPERRARLSAGAADLARQYAWGSIAARHLEVYSGLITAST